jgi:hypothetical protein
MDQAFYDNCIAQGCTPKMAEALTLRQFPGTRVEGGNDTFFQGKHNNEDLERMPATTRQRMLDRAKAAGVSIAGKVYVSGLADSPGDPKAWVSDASEIKERCAAEGWDASGTVNYKAPEPCLPTSFTAPAKRKFLRQKKEARRAQRNIS